MMLDRSLVRFKAARARGPGGMNRDHRSTKIHAWVKIADLPLSLQKKKTLREKLVQHINQEDEIFVECEETRSQELNKDRAVEHLNKLIGGALKVPPPRIPNEPPRSAEEKRIHTKKIISRKKQSRRDGREPAGNP